MRSNNGGDAKPELALRRAVHARGLRVFVSRRPLPNVRRTADLVFPRTRVAVFLDGCFWHSCPAHGTTSKTNPDYWEAKLRRNRERDIDTDALLRAAGWEPVRVWEHEDVGNAAQRIDQVVRERRTAMAVAPSQSR